VACNIGGIAKTYGKAECTKCDPGYTTNGIGESLCIFDITPYMEHVMLRQAEVEARTKADAAAAAAPVAAPAAAHHSLNLSRRSMMMMTRKMIMTF
jgi:hypothetical protein